MINLIGFFYSKVFSVSNPYFSSRRILVIPERSARWLLLGGILSNVNRFTQNKFIKMYNNSLLKNTSTSFSKVNSIFP